MKVFRIMWTQLVHFHCSLPFSQWVCFAIRCKCCWSKIRNTLSICYVASRSVFSVRPFSENVCHLRPKRSSKTLELFINQWSFCCDFPCAFGFEFKFGYARLSLSIRISVYTIYMYLYEMPFLFIYLLGHSSSGCAGKSARHLHFACYHLWMSQKITRNINELIGLLHTIVLWFFYMNWMGWQSPVPFIQSTEIQSNVIWCAAIFMCI